MACHAARLGGTVDRAVLSGDIQIDTELTKFLLNERAAVPF